MSTVLKAAATLAKKRAEDQANARKSLLERVRKMAVAIVTETDPPKPAEVIEVCDALGVSLEWFEKAVSRCESRLADVRGLERVPGLRNEAEKLEAHSRQLEQQAAGAKSEADRALALVHDPDGLRRSQYYREDATEAELERKRETQHRWLTIVDSAWIASRDARRLRGEIAELQEIDRSNIDPHSSEPSPWDFALPPA